MWPKSRNASYSEGNELINSLQRNTQDLPRFQSFWFHHQGTITVFKRSFLIDWYLLQGCNKHWVGVVFPTLSWKLKTVPLLWKCPHIKCCFLSICEKYTKIFPCRAFLLIGVHEILIEVPWFQTSPALKNSWLHPCYSLVASRTEHIFQLLYWSREK